MWSDPQAIVGETSEGTCVGWEGVPAQVWHSTDTIVSRESDHVKTEGGRAAVETVGEGSDLCESTGGEEGGESCGSTQEKDGKSESVRKQPKMKNGR